MAFVLQCYWIRVDGIEDDVIGRTRASTISDRWSNGDMFLDMTKIKQLLVQVNQNQVLYMHSFTGLMYYYYYVSDQMCWKNL